MGAGAYGITNEIAPAEFEYLHYGAIAELRVKK